MTRIDLATLADVGAGMASGTAFPGSPGTNDLFLRTDVLGGTICTYDGTRWLGPLETIPLALHEALPSFTTAAILGRVHVDGTYGMYLYSLIASVYVGTTNSGSDYWTVTMNRVDSANSATSLGTFNTSADSPDTWYKNKAIAVNGVLDASARILRVNLSLTGTPGAGHFVSMLRYRLIVT